GGGVLKPATADSGAIGARTPCTAWREYRVRRGSRTLRSVPSTLACRRGMQSRARGRRRASAWRQGRYRSAVWGRPAHVLRLVALLVALEHRKGQKPGET